MQYMMQHDPKESEINDMLKWLAVNGGAFYVSGSPIGVNYHVRIDVGVITPGYSEPLTALHAAYIESQKPRVGVTSESGRATVTA